MFEEPAVFEEPVVFEEPAVLEEAAAVFEEAVFSVRRALVLGGLRFFFFGKSTRALDAIAGSTRALGAIAGTNVSSENATGTRQWIQFSQNGYGSDGILKAPTARCPPLRQRSI